MEVQSGQEGSRAFRPVSAPEKKGGIMRSRAFARVAHEWPPLKQNKINASVLPKQSRAVTR